MIVKGITIHNTGNGKSASELYAMLLETHSPNLCHYLVDENEVINTWLTEFPASHTGKGYDFGNMNTIAIEICRSTCDYELYKKAQDRAIALVKELMQEHMISKEKIYFHRDFDNTMMCPHRILEIYGNKENFIKEEL